jgi:two-component system KDP operon response regulator KdpE
MATLRKKLEVSGETPPFIQTHVGIGYRMIRAGSAPDSGGGEGI